MYKIYYDGTIFYNSQYPDKKYKAINPTLTMGENTAGQLTFSLDPSNPGYNMIQRLHGEISVYRNDVRIWDGRVTSITIDFWNHKSYECEGVLSYLNDTTQPQAEYSGLTCKEMLEQLINIHNKQCQAQQKFTVRNVTVERTMDTAGDDPLVYTNYNSTMDAIDSLLVSKYGGHLVIGYDDSIIGRYIDYVKDYNETSKQKIEFSKNLLDFVRNWNVEEFCTSVLPLGATLEESRFDGMSEYTTIESVNNGSPRVINQNTVTQFGFIEKVVTWDYITKPANLLDAANKYLSDTQFDNMIVELSALDMNYLDVNVEALSLYDQVEVVSRPHDMDKTFPLTSMTLVLDAPQNSTYTLNGEAQQSSNLTSRTNDVNSSIKRAISAMPTKSNVLKEAEQRATALINSGTNGYVTLVKDDSGTFVREILISDNSDYMKSKNIWRWNNGGFAHSSNGYYGPYDDAAITMDGQILGKHIVGRTVTADKINLEGYMTDNKGFKVENGTISAVGAKISGESEFTGTIHAKDGEFKGNVYVKSGVLWLENITGSTEGEYVPILGPMAASGELTGMAVYGPVRTDFNLTAESLTLKRPYIVRATASFSYPELSPLARDTTSVLNVAPAGYTLLGVVAYTSSNYWVHTPIMGVDSTKNQIDVTIQNIHTSAKAPSNTYYLFAICIDTLNSY